MPTLVFDIETVSQPLDSFSELDRHVYAEAELKKDPALTTEQAWERAASLFGLSPYTGEICALALRGCDDGKSSVFYRSPGEERNEESEGTRYASTDEAGILKWFWKAVTNYDEVVTFNGRGFDIPFLLARSVALQVKPTRELMQVRYLGQQRGAAARYAGQAKLPTIVNLDLLDQLKYYGATSPMKLHSVCRAWGVTSPKGGGVDGGSVQQLWDEGRFRDIAAYNVEDVRATAEVYRLWKEYLEP